MNSVRNVLPSFFVLVKKKKNFNMRGIHGFEISVYMKDEDFNYPYIIAFIFR